MPPGRHPPIDILPLAQARQGVEVRQIFRLFRHTKKGRVRLGSVEVVTAADLVEDDANSAAVAEWKLGAAKAYRNVMVVTVGTGVGAGLILDGRLYRGSRWAGEFGHMVVLENGPACPCGNLGCLQMMSSGRTLDQFAKKHGLESAQSLASAAKNGDSWARDGLRATGHWLGLGIANVVNLLDLEAVVIGGGLSMLDDPWWSTIKRTFQTNLINADHREVEIRKAMLPSNAGLMGAIILARERLCDRDDVTDI